MKNKIVIISVVLILTIAIVAVGVVFMFKMMGDAKVVVATEPPIEDLVLQSVDIPEIMTNLKNDSYIKIAFKLQTDGVKAAEELTQRIYQFNDIVIKEALQYSAEDLQNKEQLLQFQDALLSQINAYMQNGKVTKVFITSKIIQ
ncbi:MAG TPA: flagellar basal body-associated FliL family protein [Firmicutes bacterium]|nr:flagellar basal body-associated FliL family protein [Bacillota bacterium]